MPRKYVKRWEHGKWPRPTIEETFWERVAKQEDGCWLWLGALNECGYGLLRRRTAHRFAYELMVGPIPSGLVIDHLCNVRSCVNPHHMECVTPSENSLRAWRRGGFAHVVLDRLGAAKRAKTHCPNGHPYFGENLVFDPQSRARRCKICETAKFKRYQTRVKERKNGTP